MNPISNEINKLYYHFNSLIGNGEESEARANEEEPEVRFSAQEIIASLEGKLHCSIPHFMNFCIPMDAVNTKFESSPILDSIKFWIDLFELCIKKQPLLISNPISTTLYLRLVDILEYYKTFVTDSQKLLDSKDTTALKTAAKKFQELLVDELQLHGYAYGFKGYRADLKNGGHHCPCRYQLKKKNVNTYLINKGEGLEDHLYLDHSESSLIFSIRTLPVDISFDQFKGELGAYLFLRDLTLHCTSPEPNETPYRTSQDIYNPLKIAGTLTTTLERPITDWKGKPQLGQTCASKGISLIIQDFLIQNNISLKDRKKLFLNAKLLALITIFNQFKIDPLISQSRTLCIYIVRAAQSLKVTLDKENKSLDKKNNRLTNNELILYAEVSTLILDTVKEHIKAIPVQFSDLESKSKEKPLCPYFDFADFKISAINSKPIQKPISSVVVNPAHEFSNIVITTFAEDLSNFVKALSNDSISTFKQKKLIIENFITTLPIPIKTGCLLWNAIRLDQIPSITNDLLSLLEMYIATSCSENSTYTRIKQKFLTTYSIYAVVDFLSRKLPETKLEEFHSQFWPYIHYHECGVFPFFRDGNEEIRFSSY